MFGAITAGRISIENGPQLAGVEMTPPPQRLMIVERAKSSAFRTRPLCPGVVDQMNIHFTLLQIEIDPVNPPRFPNP
jgi:hypothetical protein